MYKLTTPIPDDVSLTGDITSSTDELSIVSQPRRSAQIPQPSNTILESRDYQNRKLHSRQEGDNWATDWICPRTVSAADAFNHLFFKLEDYVACLANEGLPQHLPFLSPHYPFGPRLMDGLNAGRNGHPEEEAHMGPCEGP